MDNDIITFPSLRRLEMIKRVAIILVALLLWPANIWAQADPMLSQPLTLEAKVAGAIVKFYLMSGVTGVEYSRDGGENWNSYTSNTAVTLTNVGDKVSFRGTNSAYSNGGSTGISCTADCYVYGNIMSLINKENFATNTTLTGDYALAFLFDGNTFIKNHSSKKLVLPATTLKNYCYAGMFRGCTGLTSAPELPATTLSPFCYFWMFQNCTGLTSAPELPATTLKQYCYCQMFSGCTGLTSTPELPVTTLADHCYERMFSGCTGLTSAPELPATTLANYCYGNMFYGCTGLTSAPELPATTLADHCYYLMFYGCTGLTSAPELPAATLADYCYVSMFSGCTGLTSAPELPATTLANFCYSNMFRGCTGLTSAPALPATTLANKCYQEMFYGCENLNKVICLATNIDATNYTNSWLNGVAATGTFIKANGMSSWGSGVSGIPSGWTVVNGVNNWTDLKSAMSVNNNIVLVGNCTDPDPSSTSYLDVPANKTVVLDLNGYTIDRGLATSSAVSDGYVIKNQGTLTIQDGSTGKTGVITGGNNNNTGTESYMGGGIYNSGTLTINGGSIKNNMARQGGGIYNAGTLNISGATKITGNTLSDGTTPSNLYISNHNDGNYTVTLSAVTDGASIGVTMQTPGTFTTGLTAENVDAQMAYFSSDNLFYYVTKDNNQLKLAPYAVALYTDATFDTPVRGYETLSAAIAAAGDGDGVRLFTDVTENLNINKSGTITLDLNDKVIRGTGSGYVIWVSNSDVGNSTLNIVDNSASPTTRYWEKTGENKYWTLKDDQTPDVSNTCVTSGGCITGCQSYVAINVSGGTSLNLDGVNVVGNSNLGGIQVNAYATCTIGSKAKVCGNYSTAGGGGVFIAVNGTLNNNGYIYDNYTTTNGGGVYISGTLTNSGQICSNTAEIDGGGVYLSSTGTLNLSGASKITGNTKTGPPPTPNNLYLFTDKVATITGALTADASIGVTMASAGVFTSGLSGNGNASNFTSDDTSKGVGLTDGEAYLGTLYTIGTSATHGSISTSPATSALSGVTITVTPTPDDGYALTSLTYTPAGSSATDIITTKQFTMPAANVTIAATFLLELTSANVSVPNATYNGSSQTATVKYGETVLTKGTHYTVTGTDSRTDAGTTESFTITGTGDYTGTVSGLTFTINPKSLTIPTAATGLLWTGNEQTGVAAGEGYTVDEGTATDIGCYTATATLTSTTNYKWSDNTTEPKSIPWSIGAELFEAGATSDWRTWYSSVDMTVNTAEMETYVVTEVSSSEITISSTEGNIYKNTPMLLKRKENVTSAINGSASATALTAPTGLSTAYIGGVSTFASYTAGTVYVLAGSEFVRTKVAASTAFDPSKCFIYLTASAGSRLCIVSGGDTTGIQTIDDATERIWYTLDGRKLDTRPQRAGLYICNGKKVIIK